MSTTSAVSSSSSSSSRGWREYINTALLYSLILPLQYHPMDGTKKKR